MNKCAICNQTFRVWSDYYAHIQIPHRVYRPVSPEIKKAEVKAVESRLERFII